VCQTGHRLSPMGALAHLCSSIADFRGIAFEDSRHKSIPRVRFPESLILLHIFTFSSESK
jgi:hypothetical protein